MDHGLFDYSPNVGYLLSDIYNDHLVLSFLPKFELFTGGRLLAMGHKHHQAFGT
jgi:hypothetical protein